MNIKLRLTLLSIIAFAFAPSNWAQNGYSLNAPLIDKVEEKASTINSIWVEDVMKRTEFSSTYYDNTNQIKVKTSSVPINYYNSENVLVPINSSLIKNTNGTWSAFNQPFPTKLDQDGSFGVSIGNDNFFTIGKNTSLNSQKLNADFTVTNNEVLTLGLPGVNKQLVFRENGVKYNYILNEGNLTEGADYIFSEQIDLPVGYKIIADENYGEPTSNGWSGNLIVVDKNGSKVATMHLPICFDGAKEHTLGAYKVRVESDKTYLDLTVSNEWINSPDRVYPIVIDPLVTGPTSNWTGGQMKSCIMPTYNHDSILVNFPGEITITELNVTASFYADPFTTAVMGDGAMTFSTSCAESQSFVITGATAQTAGTAYLDYYNLVAPITCCFPESCSDTNFYLTMNLGRTGPGTGCNTTYIRYDPVTTSWPFSAVIVGKTAEAYAGQWVVPQTPVCANKCTLNGTSYVNYGVAPYTFTHPWSTQVVTQGQNIGCGNGSTIFQFTLDVPNCPIYCDENYTTLSVPPPVVTDACGNVVPGLIDEIVPIKPSPVLTPIYDSIVCAVDSFGIIMDPCITGANIIWTGDNGSYGLGNIADLGTSTSGNTEIQTYTAYAGLNGCFSDTIDVPVYVVPLPAINYITDPEPVVSGVPASFVDDSALGGGVAVEWSWDFGDGDGSTEENPTHTYMAPGDYVLCLEVTNDNGCSNSLCETITVVPAEINPPNVVTPNNDGVNDLLEFEYLEYYPNNDLVILNRWGNVIHQESGYNNDWNGIDYTEGTYFFILTITETEKEYSGFFHLIK